jgi:hypothetical protein
VRKQSYHTTTARSPSHPTQSRLRPLFTLIPRPCSLPRHLIVAVPSPTRARHATSEVFWPARRLRLLIALTALVIIILGWQMKPCRAEYVIVAATDAHDIANWGVDPAAAVTGPGSSAFGHFDADEALVDSCMRKDWGQTCCLFWFVLSKGN